MEHVGIYLLLLLYKTNALLEVTVPPSANAFVGSSILLPCTFRVDKLPINLNYLVIIWHFGETEQLKYDNRGTVPSTSRATIDDRAVLQGNASLTIHNTNISDEGTYKCLVIYSPDRQEKEIRLNIKASPTVKMTRNIVTDSKQTVLQCLVTGYYPSDVKVTWLKNGKMLTNSALSTPQQNADGTFSVNSTMSFTPAEVTDQPDIVCQAQHDSLQNPIQDGVKVYKAFPSVQIFSSPFQNNSEQLFVCEVSGLDPKFVKVSWLQNGRDMEMKDISARSGLYYPLQPVLNKELDTNISCVVQHDLLTDPVINTIQLKPDGSRQTIRSREVIAVLLPMACTAATVGFVVWLIITKSSYFQRFSISPLYGPHMLDDDNKFTFRCMAFDCVKDVQVIWTVTESDGNKVTLRDRQTMSDEENAGLISDYTVRSDRSETQELHNVITTLSFTPSVSKHKDTNVTCKFVCDGRSKEKCLKLQYDLHFHRPPKMEEITKPPNFLHHNEAKLQCKISGYFLNALDVKWFKKEAGKQELFPLSHSDQYKIPELEVMKQADNTYTCTASLIVKLSLHTDQGAEFICRVEHPSLKRPLERSTGPLIVEGVKSVSCHDRSIILDVRSLRPEDFEIKWSKADYNAEHYKEISGSNIKQTHHNNSDGSCTITNECEALGLIDLANLNVFYFTAVVEHKILNCQKEINFLRKSGKFYLLLNGKDSTRLTGKPYLVNEDFIQVSTHSGVKSVSCHERFIILEVRSRCREDFEIKWSKADYNAEHYKEISGSNIKQTDHKNSDGSCTITNECEAMELIDLANPNDFYFRAMVEHKILNCQKEMNFLRQSGNFYLVSEGKKQSRLTSKPHIVNEDFIQVSTHSGAENNQVKEMLSPEPGK